MNKGFLHEWNWTDHVTNCVCNAPCSFPLISNSLLWLPLEVVGRVEGQIRCYYYFDSLLYTSLLLYNNYE